MAADAAGEPVRPCLPDRHLDDRFRQCPVIRNFLQHRCFAHTGRFSRSIPFAFRACRSVGHRHTGSGSRCYSVANSHAIDPGANPASDGDTSSHSHASADGGACDYRAHCDSVAGRDTDPGRRIHSGACGRAAACRGFA